MGAGTDGLAPSATGIPNMPHTLHHSTSVHHNAPHYQLPTVTIIADYDVKAISHVWHSVT